MWVNMCIVVCIFGLMVICIFFGFLDWIISIVFCIFVMGNSLVCGVDKMYDGFWYNLYNDCVCYLYYLLFC